ncbi:hypothetical protein KR009_008659, partial [Drosophila setifemur]
FTQKRKMEVKLPMEPQLVELSLKDYRNVNRMTMPAKDFRLPEKNSILEALTAFWNKNEHFDFLVRIGSHAFPCHRMVIMIHVEEVRQNPDIWELELSEDLVPSEIFPTLYRWMTDRELSVKRSGIVPLLAAATHLKIEELQQQIWHLFDSQEFSEHLAIQAALDALLFKGIHHLHHLMLQRIQYYFLTFVSSVEFLSLPCGGLCFLLSSSEIAVNSEAEVFYSAIRWLNHEWPARQNRVMEVMANVRLSKMPENLTKFFQMPMDDVDVDRITQMPEMQAALEEGSFQQQLIQNVDGSPMYLEILEIFHVVEPHPRKFICHDLSGYHQAEQNAPDQVFTYADFLRYLGVL